MLLEEQQLITAAFAHCPADLKADKKLVTRSFHQIICILKLPQNLSCVVDCVVTNNATHRLETANIVISCFTLTGLAVLRKYSPKSALSTTV